ncbi:MAG: hypothetical protein ACRDQ5_12790 [Sciscionella sp.]
MPCETEDEAAYLTAFLNAPLVARAVAAYAAQLSLGVSVVEYLLIPRHDRDSAVHRELAEIAKTVTADEGASTDAQRARLDRLVATLTDIPAADRISWPPPC